MNKDEIAALAKKGQKIAKQATLAYAAYEKGLKSARKFADKTYHTITYHEDYEYGPYSHAVELVSEWFEKLPGRRQKIGPGRGSDFRSDDWVWVPVPGVSLLLQARTKSEQIDIRVPRMSDLEDLAVELQRRIDLTETEEIVLRPEAVQHTRIQSWDGDQWTYGKERRARSFNSVMLPAALQHGIEDDLKRFTESRERLRRVEMPWRRGYLLSGPPGTGKTSVSLAIAAHLGFNLASLSLTDIESDGMLRNAVSQLRSQTVLVIEDIDTYSISHDRDHNTSKDGALSLSGLLNSLDGFETPDGLVTIVTTNHVEKLDPALVRAGRLDRMFHLGHIDAPELERLFSWFYDEPVALPAPVNTSEAKVSPAEVAELFKRHLDEADAGWASVVDVIREKTAPSLSLAV